MCLVPVITFAKDVMLVPSYLRLRVCHQDNLKSFILKIHQNAITYSYIVDVSVSIRDIHHLPLMKVSDRNQNVNNLLCFDEFLIRDVHQSNESVYWNSKSCWRILMKFLGRLRYVTSISQLDFGCDHQTLHVHCSKLHICTTHIIR